MPIADRSTALPIGSEALRIVAENITDSNNIIDNIYILRECRTMAAVHRNTNNKLAPIMSKIVNKLSNPAIVVKLSMDYDWLVSYANDMNMQKAHWRQRFQIAQRRFELSQEVVQGQASKLLALHNIMIQDLVVNPPTPENPAAVTPEGPPPPTPEGPAPVTPERPATVTPEGPPPVAPTGAAPVTPTGAAPAPPRAYISMSTIQIFVLLPNAPQITIDVDPDDTIDYLRLFNFK